MASQNGQLGPQQQQTVVVSVSNSMAQLGSVPQPQQQQGIPSPTAPSAITMTPLHHPQQISADWGQGRVQVIHPQPYLQQIYSSNGQQILVPSNISLHPGLNNQQIQVIAAGKPFHGGQMGPHMMAPSQGKPVQIQQGQAASFPGYSIPTSQNQTFMFSPMNVITSQPNVLPVQTQTNPVMTGQTKNTDLQKMLGQRNGQQKGPAQVIASPINTQIQLPIQNGGQQMQFSQWQLPQVWGGQLLGPNPIFIRGPAPNDGTTFIQHPQTIQQAQPTLTLPCLGPQGQSNGPKTGVGKAVRPLSNILPSSTSPLRQSNSAGSNASTQTALQVQANAAKQAKIRSKIVSGHTGNVVVTQKQDAANQTNKVQLPSGPNHHLPKQSLVTQTSGQGSTDYRSVTPDKNQMNKILQQQQQQQQAVMYQHQQAVLQQQQQHQMVQQLAQQQLVVHYQNNQSPHMQNKNLMGMTVSNMSNNMPIVPMNQNLQINPMSVQQPLPMMQMQHTFMCGSVMGHLVPFPTTQQVLMYDNSQINQNDLISPQNSLQPPQNPMNMLGHSQHASPPPQPQLAAQHQHHLQLIPQQMQHLHLQLNQQNQQVNQQTPLNQQPLQTHQSHHNNLTLQAEEAQHNQLTPQTQQSQQDQLHQPTQVQQQTDQQQFQIQGLQQQTTKLNLDSQQTTTSNLDTLTSNTEAQDPDDSTKVESTQQPSTVMEIVANLYQENEMVTFLKPTQVLDQDDIVLKENQIHPVGTSSSTTADAREQNSFSAYSKSPEELEVAKVITEIASVAGGHYSVAPNPPSTLKTISKNLPELQILEPVASNSDTQSLKSETCTLSNASTSLQLTVVPLTSKKPLKSSSDVTSVTVSSPNASQVLTLDKQLPKATVKPNILTHVIEGFVIQEASEPFAVSRPVQEWMAERAQSSQELNREELAPKSPVRKNVANEGVLGVQRIIEEDKCHCEKPDKPSKKFSSQSCSRKPQPKKRSLPAKSLDSGLAYLETINHSENNINETTDTPVAETAKNENGTNQEPAAVKWNVEQVADFIKKIPGCAIYAEEFILQEVDGEALILIKPEHLVMSMSIKLGPALKIVASIDTLRPDKALSGETSADEVSPSSSNKSLPVFPTAMKKRKFSM